MLDKVRNIIYSINETSKIFMKKFTKQRLINIKKETNNRFKKFVINYFLKYGDTEETKTHLIDVARYGTNGGSVNCLIYYKDTENLFNRFWQDIQEIKEEWEERIGESIKIKGNLKDYLVKFAFETIVMDVVDALAID